MYARVRVHAPAKVNLFLGVGGLRADGYHELTSVFHALELADEIVVTPSERLRVSCAPPIDVPAEHNLAFRAAVAMGEAFGRDATFEIHIDKAIPHGAGLGGGSSDAAATIAGIARVWGVDQRDERCVAVAQALGADVAFFLFGGAALMTGRGDTLARELPPLGAPVVLVRPSRPVSTAAAYRVFDSAPVPMGSVAPVIAALEAGDRAALAAALSNNFEAASAEVVPEVGDALAWVRDRDGVLGSLVAGSGSAVFAIVTSDQRAEEISSEARDHGWWSAPTRLSAKGADARQEDGE